MMRKFVKSKRFFKNSEKIIPGGVNSPVRAFKAVGGQPLFIEKGRGSHIWDVDGNVYIDYVMSWGPLILGHAHPEVLKRVKEVIERGTSFGAPTELETTLAQMIVKAIPSIEKIRLVNSGTEATMSAIRLARGYTGKDMVIKFDGCYHGHVDSLLVNAGSGAATLSNPSSAGITSETASNTISLPFNNIDAVKKVVKSHYKKIACIIIEPIPGNMGVVLPQAGFLNKLLKIAQEFGIISIWDEVITGFRVAYGGIQTLYAVTPDLTCLGKIIGGGFPVGAYGGKKEIMEYVSPQGPVYQAGTLSGNPIAMAAGIETLKLLSRAKVYESLEEKTRILTKGLKDNADRIGVDVFINRIGSMFSLFFTNQKVFDYQSALKADAHKYRLFFKAMLEQGIYLAPSQFETLFVSLAHTLEDIKDTIKASFYGFKKREV